MCCACATSASAACVTAYYVGICVLHRVPPVGDKRREAWLKALGLEAPVCAKIYVCSWHFLKKDFHLHTGYIRRTAVPCMVRINIGGMVLVSNTKA